MPIGVLHFHQRLRALNGGIGDNNVYFFELLLDALGCAA
jgi:hypothetical protein